jgi:hypothetical protein
MSLEQTLEKTNTLLAQLLTVITTGLEAQATIGEPEKKTRTRKETTPPTPTQAMGLVNGDPEGTRYFLIEKHNTVYAQKPGDPDCTLPGAEIITAEHFVKKKAEFTAKTEAILAAQKSPAPTPAAASPTAPIASSPAPAASVEVGFPQIVERITALNKSPEPGHGREGVLAILRKYLPGDERPSVTKLQPLNRNAEILADIEAALAPAGAGEFDPLA